MKHIFTLCMCAALYLPMQAQNFNDYFENKTLRTDYIFTGDLKNKKFIWTNCPVCHIGLDADIISVNCH